MKYVIIHGYGSTPETSTSVQTFKEIISDYDNDAVITTPTYDVSDMANSIRTILSVVDSDTVMIGVSFGGFIARYIANMANVTKLIMVNPAIHAYNDLKQFKDLPDETYEKLIEFYVEEDSPTIGILVLLAMDDDIINPNTTNQLYMNRASIIYSDGGHRMTTLPTLGHHVEIFLNTVSG